MESLATYDPDEWRLRILEKQRKHNLFANRIHVFEGNVSLANFVDSLTLSRGRGTNELAWLAGVEDENDRLIYLIPTTPQNLPHRFGARCLHVCNETLLVHVFF